MSTRAAVRVEELVNVATHGLGLVVSVAALPFLVLFAARNGDAGTIAGVTIFGIALVGAYGTSTMYHSCAHGPRRDHWRRLDQAAVYVLIAGTYTPFTLGVLRGTLGWTVFAVVWTAALGGAGLKVLRRTNAPRLETAAYLGLGWLVVLLAEPLLQRIGWAGVAWLVAGGVAYTVGVAFLVSQSRIRWGHCAWHLFVLGGSTCHAIAILNYALIAPS
jgi:hemolysin III